MAGQPNLLFIWVDIGSKIAKMSNLLCNITGLHFSDLFMLKEFKDPV